MIDIDITIRFILRFICDPHLAISVSSRADQNTGSALLKFPLRTATGDCYARENVAFRLQYLFAIINQISKLVSRQWW